MAKIGVIGGSGLYEMDGLTDVREVSVRTPFGDPSDAIVTGRLGGVELAFLPRHGRGHRISPSELPVRANIYALKSLGVQWVISVSAVGSLREDIKPLHLVIPDQIIDRTKRRPDTFFEGGIVAHCAFAEPYCPHLSEILHQAAQKTRATVHKGGTYVAIEGPQFSTKAESALYRSWGASVVGMTALPAARLAREAELCYASLASVTDYDCWYESEESVSVHMIVSNLLRNVAAAKKIVRYAAQAIHQERKCACASALEDTIITVRERIPAEVKERLQLLIGKYL
jgi:5'-methylthioadenosine phosphorylase